MNDRIFYLDSKDALSAGFKNSADYAYCIFVRVPESPSNELPLRIEDGDRIDTTIFKLLKDKGTVSFLITDVLYYRYLLSIASLFAPLIQPDVMDLLIKAASQVYDSMSRDSVVSLLDAPEWATLEQVLDGIQSISIALDEVLSIKLFSRIREIHVNILEGDSEDFLHSFVKDASNVIPFSLLTRKKEITSFVSDSKEIITFNPESYILSHLNNVNINGEQSAFYKSINDFCVSICSIFSALFVEGEESGELNDVYRNIWNFIIRTKSYCFLPKKAFDKARDLLL